MSIDKWCQLKCGRGERAMNDLGMFIIDEKVKVCMV